MLKIGLVTGEYPPMEGGVGAFTQELAKALAALGHQLHIITDKQARGAVATPNWRILREPLSLAFAELHPFVRKWRWSSLSTVTDVVVRQELDLVNIQYQPSAYDMRSAAVNLLPWRLKGVAKTAVTFHDLRVPYLFPKAGRLRQTAVRFMANQADGAIVTNQADYEALSATVQTPIAQIPIGSNIPTYKPEAEEITAVRARLHLAPADRLLGYFGFLNESKGADTLLEALAGVDDRYHLVFIGGQTGSSDSRNNQQFLDGLRGRIEALGLTGRVHWTGFVMDKEVSTYLHTADMMVMPYRDGVSLRRGTLMAALAHGRPLISTIAPDATPALVHGENIWMVAPNNAPALMAAIQKLDADSDLRERLGEGAKGVAGLFSWERIAEETAVFFENLAR